MGTAFWIALVFILIAFGILICRFFIWIKEEKIRIYDIGALLDIEKNRFKQMHTDSNRKKTDLWRYLVRGREKSMQEKLQH